MVGVRNIATPSGFAQQTHYAIENPGHPTRHFTRTVVVRPPSSNRPSDPNLPPSYDQAVTGRDNSVKVEEGDKGMSSPPPPPPPLPATNPNAPPLSSVYPPPPPPPPSSLQHGVPTGPQILPFVGVEPTAPDVAPPPFSAYTVPPQSSVGPGQPVPSAPPPSVPVPLPSSVPPPYSPPQQQQSAEDEEEIDDNDRATLLR